MKIYTTTEFTGHYPVGTAALVVAEDRQQAAEVLNRQLQGLGLPGDASPDSMVPVIVGEAAFARILCNGDY